MKEKQNKLDKIIQSYAKRINENNEPYAAAVVLYAHAIRSAQKLGDPENHIKNWLPEQLIKLRETIANDEKFMEYEHNTRLLNIVYTVNEMLYIIL